MIIDQAEVVMGKHFTTPQWKNGKIMHQSRVIPREFTNGYIDEFG